ncbi:MAG: GGDEF domain-containing protein [Myxococcota bacterium]
MLFYLHIILTFLSLIANLVLSTIILSVDIKLKKEVRSTDVIARFGGDEFVILLPEANKLEAISLAERIKSNTFKENLPYKYRIVSGSFGVTTFRVDKSLSSEIDLLKLADSALYRSKRLGRDRVSHSDEVGEE